MDELVRWIGAEAHENARWMGWNALLALVPLGIAILVFRPGRRLTPAWWMGATFFLLFLPNAPYVLTDVVHLLHDVREEPSNAVVLVGVLPLYTAFFAIGFGAYVLSLRRVAAFLVEHGWGSRWVIAELALHGLCAVGIYLGRIARLNSWDAITDPGILLAGLDRASRPVPLVAIALVVALLLLAATAARVLLDAITEIAHRRFGTLRSE